MNGFDGITYEPIAFRVKLFDICIAYYAILGLSRKLLVGLSLLEVHFSTAVPYCAQFSNVSSDILPEKYIMLIMRAPFCAKNSRKVLIVNVFFPCNVVSLIG